MRRPRARNPGSPMALRAPPRSPATGRLSESTSDTRASRAVRNGLSLPRGGCPFPDHLCGIYAPGLLLHRTAECAPTHPLPQPGSPLPARQPAQGLVATHPVFLTVPRLFAPLGDLSIPPDQSSLRFAVRKLAFAERPLSVPPRDGGIAPTPSDQRSEFAAFRVARQLRKPLGTSIIVHQAGDFVNKEEPCAWAFSAALLP
jgi:hypothetical protein